MLRTLLGFVFAVGLAASLAAGQTAPAPPPDERTAQAPAPKSKENAPQKPASPPAQKAPDPEAELARVLEESGNDRAALVRKLEEYLRRFPDAPRKAAIYRTLVEAYVQLRDTTRALDYTERIIALTPEDGSMMMLAIELLQRAGDDHSLERAVGYATRVLDRLEKAPAIAKPARVTQADWESDQKRLLMSVYLMRGRLQLKRRLYDAAAADLQVSYRLLPSGAAALHLGEIFELRKEYDKAIEQYAAAFVLPDQYGLQVDRSDVRRKIGNLWRLTHGSEAGLGEKLLQVYDKVSAEPKPADSPVHNKSVNEIFSFVLRRPNGAAAMKMEDAKGKVVVLNFWATWCLPCRVLEPLFERLERHYEGKSEVVFLAVNGDEDESRVKPYIEQEKMRTPVVFADGLDTFFGIRGLPTVIVLDRSGKMVYRAQGFAPEGFVEALTTIINRALASASAAPSS